MKIFITGGAGFIGSALIRHIINNTSHEVLNYDALKYSGNLNSLASIKDSNRYSFVKGDICNYDFLKETIFTFQPHGIIHLAAESHVDRSIDDPSPFIQSNIIGTYNLLDSSYKFIQSLDKNRGMGFTFHHVSTDEVYGDIHPSEPPCDENHFYDPSSPYSASKASSDHLVRSWNRTFNFPSIITNCSNNYGPFHFPEKLIPTIILNAIQEKDIPIYGDGQQIRDWIYVDDHVRGLLLAFEEGEHGQTYNIGASNEIKNIDIASKICELLDELYLYKTSNIKSYKDLITFVTDRPGHDQRYAIDSSKIQSNLGWKVDESFESGLRKTVQWYLNNQSWWQPILNQDFFLERIGIGELE
jgi:dTDP-glucose 4,6-dehydratase